MSRINPFPNHNSNLNLSPTLTLEGPVKVEWKQDAHIRVPTVTLGDIWVAVQQVGRVVTAPRVILGSEVGLGGGLLPTTSPTLHFQQ